MTKKLIQKVTCNNCGKTTSFDVEEISASGRFTKSKSPLSAVIVKKFECGCSENPHYQVEIISEDEVKSEKRIN